MKKLLVIVAFLVVGYKVFTIYQAAEAKLEPQYREPYIVVYGRKTSRDTVHLQTELLTRGLRYRYVDMDAEGATDALNERMKRAGLDATSYLLPVVEVNARMRVNPTPEWVADVYHVDHTGKRL